MAMFKQTELTAAQETWKQSLKASFTFRTNKNRFTCQVILAHSLLDVGVTCSSPPLRTIQHPIEPFTLLIYILLPFGKSPCKHQYIFITDR